MGEDIGTHQLNKEFVKKLIHDYIRTMSSEKQLRFEPQGVVEYTVSDKSGYVVKIKYGKKRTTKLKKKGFILE